MMGLTKRQSDALSYIRAYVSDHGISPTYTEIAQHIGVTGRGGIHRLLNSLRDRGYVTFGFGQARSIRLLGDDMRHRSDSELHALIRDAQAELRRRAS